MTGPRPTPIIDSHTHVWPATLIHPAQLRPVALQATPADLLATTGACGVDRAIVSPAAVYPDNDYVIRVARLSPSRLSPVVGIEPVDASAIAQIQGLVHRGAVGIRILLGEWPLSRQELRGLDRLVEVAWAVGSVLQWAVTPTSAGLVERAATRAPGVRHVLDHLGLPADVRDMQACRRITALATIPTVHVKVSGIYALSRQAYPFEDTWRWTEAIMEAFGSERAMWGSDWPLALERASYEDLVALTYRYPFLDHEGRQMLMHRAAERFWGPVPGV